MGYEMKKIVIVFIIILCLGGFFFNSYGVSTLVNLETSKKIVSPYEEFFVTINLQNLGGMDSSSTAVQGFLEYDEKIFQKVTEKSIALNNLNCNLSYNESTKQLVILRENFKNDTCIVKIKFKAKENIVAKSTDIKINNVQVFEGNENLITSNAKVSIDVKDKISVAASNVVKSNTTTNASLSSTSGLNINSNEEDLVFYTDKYTNTLKGLQQNMPFLNSNNKHSMLNLLTEPLSLMFIFVGGYFGVIIFEWLIKVMCEWFKVRKEIYRSRKTSRSLRKVLINLEKY